MIIETEKLDAAIRFVKRMSDGKNPITGTDDTGTVFDHPEMIRNMYFVLNVLHEIKSGELKSGTPDPFPCEILEKFSYKEDKGIKSLLSQIYSPVQSSNILRLTPQAANSWLRSKGYLEYDRHSGTQSGLSLPTESGAKIGLYSQVREYQGRRFTQVYFSRAAQEFIVAHFPEILADTGS